ncbi:tumor necrosis factor receptor superfamily member 4 [Notothenia coriiceps]|uniref:Tumor necrosis factor receptor superfamily member 4 n=1 Tax=Notothenia coriiceps TaxID=8208 RepID=A0A6I9NY59_9TELE|nr:PREDICTED: tumor necrosis factor receptor superfamily member 4-like [Notothenia coriiceps]
MVLLKLLIFTLTFYELVFYLDAETICPKGQKVKRVGSVESCESCPVDNYQDEENTSQNCKACIKCDATTGSVLKKKCTKETNTDCQCRTGFVRYDDSSCKCNKGFGLKRGEKPECSECEEGFFSSSINSKCQKWKECKSGVKFAGKKKSDVICNVDSYTTPTTSNERVSLLTRLTSHHSHKAQNPATNIKTTTSSIITTAGPGHTRDKGPHLHPFAGAGMVLIIIGMIGLLVLTAVTCKLHFNPKPAVTKSDSLCRSPVEESGDDSQSSLKLNPEEP